MTATEAQTLLTAMRGAHIALDGQARKLRSIAVLFPEQQPGIVMSIDSILDAITELVGMMDRLDGMIDE